MKWLKLIWKDNVISGIIVAVITAGTGAWFWEYVKRAMITVGGWASYKVTLPVWAVFIISLILLSLIPVLMLYAKSKVGGDSVEPKFFKYTKDNIFGINVTWRWSRNFGSYECYVSNLNKRCPKCHAILDENDYSYPTISCITDWCGWQPEEKYAGLHSSELQQKIYTEIDRRVHSGEYKLR
ncbi:MULTISPECIES: hypothetical protein [Enterobacteriaceae]|jgi:hypothetical protein|uniref:Uncharacterized protein n=1 Tax=Phytobacter ursingii TaxID=1972431 RepID=A0AB35RL80_9ENTR|nr:MULTISPECIES: hypothetical protein [Enterobacteriaceae]MDV2862545.1 hypothetical protein [Phytobacter ursingii]